MLLLAGAAQLFKTFILLDLICVYDDTNLSYFLPLVFVISFVCQHEMCAGVGRCPALQGLWRIHCPHLRRQYMFNDSLC